HHEMGHGTRLDEYLTEAADESPMQAEEYAANVFAGAFLMPRATVNHAFRLRGWAVDAASPAQVYVVACALGGSYEGLLTHLSVALRLLSRDRAAELARTPLPKLRELFVDGPCSPRLVVADLLWSGIAIDLTVGECALLPSGAGVDGVSVRRVQS